MTSISGSTVLVTGGQRGLGKAFVEAAIDLGAATVYATARRPQPSADPRVVPLALEVTDPSSVAALADQARDVSILVNNAGATLRKRLIDTTVDELRDLLETNLFGVLRVTQALAPTLAANGGGTLINIHSAMSWIAGAGPYGVTKAALWSATNSLRIDLAAQGTQVVGVHLGYTETDMTAILDVVKNDPRELAHAVLVAAENGQTEVLSDEVSRHFKAALSGPVEGLEFTLVDGKVVGKHASAAARRA
ncbi:SDR family oxidoreductase [Pseudonocardia alaniniphila]|uniref:SDR family oxidoreductase n=1 Tax=Pseudonocardia alaniniphila TaxID=75291 RepID=A0ABS9TD25_9PSEU|nr:SDR family oxidoreductase [Pseudonocardia alaniniphila]MCH6166428.1 SDR family oxidoreductase [Pseudonocardia alaniniphila]